MVTNAPQSDHTTQGERVTSREFMKHLQERAIPGLSEASLEFAAQDFRCQGRTTERDIPDCLRLARRLNEFLAFCLQREALGTEPMADEDDSHSPPGLTPDDLIRGIDPWVKEIRQQE